MRSLVAGAQSGDREAMELLLTRHQPWIFNLAVRILRRADAEDATQEVLLKAARARRDLYSYLRGNCSLVNPDAACKCARKTRAFIQGGFVDPLKLKFTSAYQRKVRDVAVGRADELGDAYMQVAAQVYRDHPFYEPAEQVARLREALKALALDLPVRPGPIEERKEVNG